MKKLVIVIPGLDEEATIGTVIGQLEAAKVHVMRLCSFVYAGSLVTSGEALAGMYPGQHAFDAAAVKLLVEEAGGKVTDLAGNEQRYDRPINGALASNGAAHDELLKIIAATATKR